MQRGVDTAAELSDVLAQKLSTAADPRAKQLRKGARPRLEDEIPQHHKAERVAMEEVRRGLVYYDVPPSRPAPEAAK